MHHCLIDPRLQARECQTDRISTVSDIFSALAICDEHRSEVLEFVKILQGLTIKQEGLALLTRDRCRYDLGLRSASVHTDYSGVADNSSKQTLHLAVATAQDHGVR